MKILMNNSFLLFMYCCVCANLIKINILAISRQNSSMNALKLEKMIFLVGFLFFFYIKQRFKRSGNDPQQLRAKTAADLNSLRFL